MRMVESAPACPYCGGRITGADDFFLGSGDGEATATCDHCRIPFVLTRSTTVAYSARKFTKEERRVGWRG